MRWLYHMNGPADAATFQWNICSINRSCPDWKSDTQTHTHSKRFFIVNKVEDNRKKRNVYWLLWFLILNKTPLLKAIMKTAVYVEFCWEAIFTKLLFLSIGVTLISVMLAISPRCHQLLALFVKGNSDTVLKYEGWLRPFFPLHNTQHTTKTPQYWKTFHSKLKAYLQTWFESL